MQFSNDLGYSSMKSTIDGQYDKFPSVIAKASNINEYEPVQFTSKSEEKTYMENFMDHLFVSINSPAVGLEGRYFVGNAAANTSLPMLKFDVNDFSGKSESDLAPYLSLSTIAGKAVQQYYKKNQKLPDTLSVQVEMATALPVSEGKKKGVANSYKDKYLSSKHIVTFNNFVDPIIVSISFKQVYVGLEGELAQLYINNADNDLKKLILGYLKQNYPKIADSMSIDDFLGLKDILSIDLGGGTSDSVLIADGKANANASESLKYGWGNVLQEAVVILQDKKINFADRTALQEYLLTTPNPISKEKYDYVKQIVMETAESFIDQVVAMASRSLRKAGSNVSVVYVYGGAANALSDSTLKDKLNAKIAEFNGGFEVPIVWIDEKYAQYLNEKGLELVSDYMFKGSDSND